MTAALVQPDLADHPFGAAIAAQLPSDVWDLRVFGYAGHPSAARFRGRADRAGRGATDITQPWLLAVVKEWVLRAALRRISSSYLDNLVMSVAMLSATLRERDDGGNRPAALGRTDMSAHLLRLGRLRAAGLISQSGQQRAVQFLAHVLDDARSWGLTETGAVAGGLPDLFTVQRSDRPAGVRRGVDEPSRALPRVVVRQLLEPAALNLLTAQAGVWAGAWFRIALGTGRRPGELARLPLASCLDWNTYRDEAGVERTHPVLVHDMSKVGIIGYRLPITTEVAALITEQQQRVEAAFPSTDRSRLPLFPAPFHNPDGLKAVPTWQIGVIIRTWVEALPRLDAPDKPEDGRAWAIDPPNQEEADGEAPPFPRNLIFPYAFRHTWAQDHADAGTPLEVLQDLLGHAKPSTTQGYYRMTHARRREAVTRLSRLQLTNTGSLVAAGLRVLEVEDGIRGQVGSVAVPFGMCTEPNNVQAGGQSCPYRMRCLGCSHFRTDPSYLPELREYLTQLLVTRERLHQPDADIEPWARRSAMPAAAEVNRVRHLIKRCENQLDSLTPDEREEIEECIGQTRSGRSRTANTVPLQLLGMVRTHEPDIFPNLQPRLPRLGLDPTTGTVR